MTTDPREAKAAHIRRLLAEEGDAVAAQTRESNQGRYDAVADTDGYQELRSEARAIKEDAIDRLPELIEDLREAVTDNGGHLYVADDDADANRYIREVVADRDADRVVKSKSMTSEELDVNDALAAEGVDVVETDLGEWVIQLADEAPSHLVGPAMHKSRAEIATLLNERFEPDPDLETADELTRFARQHLLERIKTADVGMTGANFVVAESGTIALVTNEGNARKCAVAPDTHVVVAGIEKVIPTVADLAPFGELIGRAGTGQDITAYFSLLTPPVESPVVDFEDPETPMADRGHVDREFHLVLVDNGRWAMRDDEHLRETLYCIRCGACANACGNFQSVGGHAFGGETYTGGIAGGWEAGVEGLESAATFNDLCTGCSTCVPACPVEIDVPWINTVVRDRVSRDGDPERFDWLVEGLSPDGEPGRLDPQKRLFGNAETLARLGSATAPVSNWLAEMGPVRGLLERLFGIDRRRDLPDWNRQTLVGWFEDRGAGVDPADAARETILYPDVYTNYAGLERGKAAVRALEAMDVHVRVPHAPGSGRAPLSQGMVTTATRKAERVLAALEPGLGADRDVVVVEPSALAMFHREYGKLVDDDRVDDLRANSYDVMEYLYGCLANGGEAGRLRGPGRSGVDDLAYHPHCQARTLEVASFAEATLAELGYDVITTETECCGMAGSFGYKQEYYELSMDVGEPIRRQLEDESRTVVACGTSCLEHVGDLLGTRTRHPVELVAPSERRGR